MPMQLRKVWRSPWRRSQGCGSWRTARQPSKRGELTLKDGTVYWFPEAALQTNPAKAAVKQIRDRFGNTLQFVRDGVTGDLVTLTSPNGRWISFTYDASRRITVAADNLGRRVQYQYDASGRLTQVTDPNGGVTQYTYDADHRMLTLRDARGITYLTNAYDTSGRVITQTQADNTTFQFAYTVDVNNTITQTDVTDPRAIVERVTFNSQGYVLTDTRALGRPEQQVTTYARQAGTSLVQSVTDALGRQTTFTYDTKGNVTAVTRLAGTPQAVTTSLTWEAPAPTTFNRLKSGTTGLAYDMLNQLRVIGDPGGGTTRFNYDPNGNLLSVTDARGNSTSYVYNGMDRLTTRTDPLAHSETYTYDNNGNPTSFTDRKSQVTSTTYDGLDRPTVVTYQDSSTTSYTWDAGNRVTQIVDSLGGTITRTYDGLDRLTSETTPEGSVSYTYDINGRPAGVTVAGQPAFSYG